MHLSNSSIVMASFMFVVCLYLLVILIHSHISPRGYEQKVSHYSTGIYLIGLLASAAASLVYELVTHPSTYVLIFTVVLVVDLRVIKNRTN